MLFKVTCRKYKNHFEFVDYLPFPDGIEAKSKKNAIQKCKKWIIKNNTDQNKECQNDGRCIHITDGIDTYTYADFKAKMIDLNNPMGKTSPECAYDYADELIQYITKRGYKAEEYTNCMVPVGVRVCTGIDTWIVDIHISDGIYAHVILLHKNNIDKNNEQSKIPDFHKQTSGIYSCQEITDVMLKHTKKMETKG